MLDTKKAIETLVYIAHNTDNLIYIMKVLYFADKYHLSRHGRFITGDSYIAMQNGPVPSGAYDLVKYVRGDGYYKIDAGVEEALKVFNNTKVEPLRKPNLEYLSESDIECLDIAIEEIIHLSFDELMEKCQREEAYIKSKENYNHEIPFSYILNYLDNSEEVLEYLNL